MVAPVITALGTPATSAGTTLTLNMPASVNAGRYLIAFVGNFGSVVITPPSGFVDVGDVVFGNGSPPMVGHAYAKVSDGTETGTVNFGFSTTNRRGGFIISTTANLIHLVSAGSDADDASSIDQDRVTPTIDETLILYPFFAALAAQAILVADMTPAGTFLTGAEIARNTTNSIYVGLGYESHAAATITPARTATNTGPAAMLGQFTMALGISDPEITLINDGDYIEDGQSGVVIEHADFGTITGVTLKGSDGGDYEFSHALSFTNGTDETTVAFPAVYELMFDAAGVPFSESFTLSVEITDGAATASQEITLVPSAGYEVFETLDAQTGLGFIFNGFETPIPDGTPVLYPTTGDTTLTAAGGIESNLPVDSIIAVKIFDLSDGVWRVHSVILIDEDDGGGPVWMGMGFIEFIQPVGFIG